MNGILLSAMVDGIRTRKDGTVSITLGTQELSSGRAGEVFSLNNKLAAVYISPKEVSQREIDQVDKLEPDLPGKSPSQRLRNVLFIIYSTTDAEGFKEFDSYYKVKMEQIIEQLKTKIKD
jgi:hypothetical protein